MSRRAARNAGRLPNALGRVKETSLRPSGRHSRGDNGVQASAPSQPRETAMPSNLRIDPERLWSTLMETAAIGGTAKGGINRQTLTAEDAPCAPGSSARPRRWAAG